MYAFYLCGMFGRPCWPPRLLSHCVGGDTVAVQTHRRRRGRVLSGQALLRGRISSRSAPSVWRLILEKISHVDSSGVRLRGRDGLDRWTNGLLMLMLGMLTAIASGAFPGCGPHAGRLRRYGSCPTHLCASAGTASCEILRQFPEALDSLARAMKAAIRWPRPGTSRA